MSEVFISYFRDDMEKVDVICEALTNESVPIWIDRNKLESGQNWSAVIEDRIGRSLAFILCASAKLETRPQSPVHREVLAAARVLATRHREEQWYFPILLERCQLPGNVIRDGRRLTDYHAVDATRDIRAGAIDLARRVASFIHNPDKNLAEVSISNRSSSSGYLRVDGDEVSNENFRDVTNRNDPRYGAERMKFVPGTAATLKLRPGKHTIQLADEGPDNDPFNPTGERSFVSNIVDLQLGPLDKVAMIIRDPRKTGFLWMNSESPHTWVLEVVAHFHA
jgi:TIR domain